jgi:hypothetical protein
LRAVGCGIGADGADDFEFPPGVLFDRGPDVHALFDPL